MRIKLFLLVTILVTSHSLFADNTKNLRWKITNETWNDDLLLSYQEFIHILGLARKNGQCKTTDECLRSPIANPKFYKMNPSKLVNIFSDCADLPYILRAYFSWMNELPFSFTTDLVEASSKSSDEKDIRYSKFGNIIEDKYNVKNGDNINKILEKISDSISTATYRTNAETNDSGELFRDTYPVSIDRNSIVPGTVLYDANGHVAVVYDITNTGKILLIDAHPDNSLTTITYGKNFARTMIQLGGGFSNFRPFAIHKNKVQPKQNTELLAYSLIQYQAGPFIYKDQKLSFYDYVRNMMADGVIIYNPTSEFSDLLDELCQDIKDREQAVNTSIAANLQNQPHPELLPENIYGADGEWEIYASPSRDARLKASVEETKEYLEKVITGFSTNNKFINFTGSDLVKDLREIYLAKTQSCIVNATPEKLINLDFVLTNLFALSFDPYHCAELRWGMLDSADCDSTSNKMTWYNAEQGLRNRIERDYNIKTNYDEITLPNTPASKVDKPDLIFDKLLEIER